MPVTQTEIAVTMLYDNANSQCQIFWGSISSIYITPYIKYIFLQLYASFIWLKPNKCNYTIPSNYNIPLNHPSHVKSAMHMIK